VITDDPSLTNTLLEGKTCNRTNYILLLETSFKTGWIWALLWISNPKKMVGKKISFTYFSLLFKKKKAFIRFFITVNQKKKGKKKKNK
jgi:hypothetical protein